MAATLEQDAEALRKAMKGFGTDDSALIKIIANRTNEHRQKLKLTYKTMFGKDLITELKSETSGCFEDAIVALFETPIDYDCISLRTAMKGLGTNEDTLIEILCTRPRQVLVEIIKRFKEMYNRDLEADVKSETSGSFQRLLISLLQCKRSDNKKPDEAQMEAFAKELYGDGKSKLSSNEILFSKIFTLSSKMELVHIARNYHKISGRTLFEAIDKDLSGNTRKAVRTIVFSLISPAEYFATRLMESMKGAGTRDAMLIRICVTRDEIDMPQIKQYYRQLYKHELIEDIIGDCSGSYKNLLIELCDH